MTGRIVVLISGSGSNMEELAAACDRGEVPGQVVAVVADRECVGLKAAEAKGIDAVHVDFKGFSSREGWSAALRDAVQSYNPDLVVSAGFMRVTSPVFVDAFSDRYINLHPALLPSFPGAHGVRDALEAGVKWTGSTVHFVDYEVDHGPIVMQEPVRIEEGDDEETLHERIKKVEHRMLPIACRLVLERKVRIENGRTRIDD
ncbi:MAG: phosphoribosylglycinamide formyltransferase 1 [Actinomycetota bacterium]|jgi:phosphoribosylglycinamide formyltransferase-1|nr:phosphoribosylglycinamide formyltransferase 1 [Actinomycetota bacterium]